MRSKVIKILFKKELLDVIRDRKAMLMLILVPLLIYPLIFFGSFAMMSMIQSGMEQREYRVVADVDDNGEFALALNEHNAKNSEKASSFCNDVIGDICGIVSGSAGVALAAILSSSNNFDMFITTLIITAIIAALTIGGKAIGKATAINKSTVILYEFSKVASLFLSGK